MRKMLVPAFVMLTAFGPCCAQTASLSVVRLDCRAPLSPMFSPPATQQEREQISTEWVGADELAVESWDEETAESRVDPGTAKMHLDGSTVTLSYSYRSVAADRSKSTPACKSLIKLFFTVSELPRSRYQLRIQDGHGRIRQFTIDG